MTQVDLGSALRAWRDRIDPADVGLVAGPRRRAPGLRRQELATLAGLSVEYLARLEQNRASHPSPSVLAPLARALRLSVEERDHLFALAGQAAPPGRGADGHITPSVRRILDRLEDVAVHVVDPAWNVVEANAMAQALLGPTVCGPERNVLRAHFSGAPSWVEHSEEEDEAFEHGAAADLRAALARHPEHEEIQRLVDELQASSPRFATVWRQRDVTPRFAQQKTIAHPEVGRMAVDCDVLEVAGSSLRLIVYTAAPGTEDAERMGLLGAIGTQSFGAGPT